MIKVAKFTSPNYIALAKKTNKAQIITIDYSHFCEFAIWALQAQKVPLIESGFAPGQHILPTLSVRVGGNEHHISSSSRTAQLKPQSSENTPLLQTDQNNKKQASDDKARATAVPLAVLPNGTILRDSWEIASYPGKLSPVDPELRKLLDEEVGPLARQLTYVYVLKASNSDLWNALCTRGRHWLWRFAWWLFMGSFITKRMKKVFQPDNQESVNQCRERLKIAVEKVGVMISTRSYGLNPVHRDPENPLVRSCVFSGLVLDHSRLLCYLCL